jgi:hypothetical protein
MNREPQNNGMKLTARGASDEARQLIPVFCGRRGAWSWRGRHDSPKPSVGCRP